MARFPSGMASSLREFKRGRRRAFIEARPVLHQLRMGCAFLPAPAYKRVVAALALLKEADRECQPWWRKA